MVTLKTGLCEEPKVLCWHVCPSKYAVISRYVRGIGIEWLKDADCFQYNQLTPNKILLELSGSLGVAVPALEIW